MPETCFYIKHIDNIREKEDIILNSRNNSVFKCARIKAFILIKITRSLSTIVRFNIWKYLLGCKS